MALLAQFIDLILHLDTHLNTIIAAYGILTYALLFLIIFLETGLVVTPFLPGDSLIFAVGAISAQGSLNVFVLFALLSLAAIIGNTVNYQIGAMVGPKIFKKDRWFLKREYLQKTEHYFEKFGGKTIVITRFIPIIRTFAPFVAGIGKMNYRRFFLYNLFGGLLWVGSFVFGGYFFGNIPIVKENFGIVVIAIIVISLIPAVIEVMRHMWKGSKQK